ncbi:MAG: MgtC/SapB family protein [Lachnospiraceae bacterium]|nr:MgtC/SapB family protein [Lachnospiraceae bacterium]
MTLAQYLNSQFSIAQNVDFCIRILVAAIAGGIIGLERSHRFKEAGVRTHIIVCCTTAVIMILSKYGFGDMVSPDGAALNGSRGADAARIAAQAVSGISFLCAGVIFKNGSNVRGLTTAAGLWLTAGLGLAFGAGMYVVGAFALILLLVLQFVIHYIFPSVDAYSGSNLKFTTNDDSHFYADLSEQLKQWKAKIVQKDITYNSNGTTEYSLIVRRREEISHTELKEFVKDRTDIISYSNNSLYNHFR